jgi:Fe-Mn family superoxide dismutase
MSIKESTLPYRYDALEPHVSSKTLRYHHDEHHNGYIKKLNGLIDGTSYENLPLEVIIVRAREDENTGVFTNAAQTWNHSFLWESMSPSGEAEPEGRIKNLVEESFGNIDAFKNEFRERALGLTGSGWVWLVQNQDKLVVKTTQNADTPIGTDVRPLLVLDVWEHAYYLDYQNLRADYVAAFLDNLINWKFAASNLRSDAPQLTEVA